MAFFHPFVVQLHVFIFSLPRSALPTLSDGNASAIKPFFFSPFLRIAITLLIRLAYHGFLFLGFCFSGGGGYRVPKACLVSSISEISLLAWSPARLTESWMR